MEKGDLHRDGAQRLEHSKESVCMEKKTPIDKTIGSDITRWPRDEIAFWRFETHAQGGEYIGLQKKYQVPRDNDA